MLTHLVTQTTNGYTKMTIPSYINNLMPCRQINGVKNPSGNIGYLFWACALHQSHEKSSNYQLV